MVDILCWLLSGAWLQVVTALIAIVALGVSIKSNFIAKDALETTQRPFINVSIKPTEAGDKFEISKHSDRITIIVKLKIENTGHSIAKGISMSPITGFMGPPDELIRQDNVSPPPTISLGPGQDVFTTVAFEIVTKDVDAVEQELKSDKFIFKCRLIWTYTGMLSDAQYETTVALKTSRKETVILEQQME